MTDTIHATLEFALGKDAPEALVGHLKANRLILHCNNVLEVREEAYDQIGTNRGQFDEQLAPVVRKLRMFGLAYEVGNPSIMSHFQERLPGVSVGRRRAPFKPTAVGRQPCMNPRIELCISLAHDWRSARARL